jgi:hypothetical protein
VSRRILMVILAFAALAAPATSSFAASKSKPRKVIQTGFMYASRSLKPGHRYQVTVSSPSGKVKFVGNAIETYTWVRNRQFGESNKSVHLAGTTPKKFTIKQPVPVKLNGWLIALSVQDTSRRPLVVRFVDLNAHK